MLKRVSIQNFKSLKDVTLDLQKVNLLIGANNSGKTNFLKALEIINTIDDERNYFDIDILFKKTKFNNPLIYLVFDNVMPWEEEGYTHYKISSRAEARFVSEKITLKIAEGSNQDINALPLEFPENPINKERNIFLTNLQYELKNVRIYKPDPNKLTQPGPVGTGEEIVSANSSNLVGFLDLMLSKYRRSTFNQIETDLSKCVPEFVEIKLDDAARTEELIKLHGRKDYSFKRVGLRNGRQDITYWADELSEGTLYFLALLCIINQPNPPKLLLLEEPEKGIHPRRIREVMDFIFRLAEEKDIQIILTSHNEHVLDDFATRPEAVFVFDKDEEGATYVRNLQTDIIKPTNQRNRELGLDEIDLTTNLSENWLYGLLGGVPSIP